MEDARAKCERAKAVRRANRGVVTKLVKEVDETIGTTPLSEEGIARLKVIHKQLESKANVLSELDREITSLCEVDEIEREVEEAEVFTAKIIGYKRKIEETLKTTQEHTTETPAMPASVNPLASNTYTRLPKLVLPRFKGDVTKWTSFWDSFNSAIHQNTQISKVDKFNYLNSLLEGTAASSIQGLTLSESNYDSAIELLKERFGKPQQIIAAHMDELLKIQACTSERPGALRQVYDKINIHVRGLNSLGINSEQYGSLLIPVIMTKISNDMRLRIARQSGDEVWKLEDLMGVIKTEVEARETSEGTRAGQHRQMCETPNPRIPNRHGLPSASALVSNEFKIRCAFCEGPHYSASCDKVKAVKDRRDVLLKARKCFNCLKPNHKVKECHSTHTCRLCHRKHHQSICDQQSGQMQPSNGDKSDTQNDTTTLNSNAASNGKTVLLQTAQGIALNPDNGRSRRVRILFDNGSQHSYVTEELRHQLRLKPEHHEKLQLNMFGDQHHKLKHCDVVQLNIYKTDSSDFVKIVALCFPTICTNLPLIEDISEHSHLVGLQLADNPEKPRDCIDVLIGSDFYWDIVTGDLKLGEKGPIAISSRLGWLLSGPIESTAVANLVSSHMIVTQGIDNNETHLNNDQLTVLLKRFWETETLGTDDAEPEILDNDFLRGIEFIDGHYQIPLPWKRDRVDIPDHFSLSFNRLKLLQCRLLKRPELLREYDDVIKDQLTKGIIESVKQPVLNAADKDNSIHYLPHHAIVRQDRQTTKIRVVYDGSAKERGQSFSLNDCLHTGPNYIPLLFDILIRFRSYPIAVTADIEKAFLMVHIAKKDRDSLRFLWLRDPLDCHSEPLHFRFTRLVFGLRPAPAILGAVITHHLEKYKSKECRTTELLKESLYVDDLVAGAANEEEGMQLYQTAKSILLDAGMNLRKWQSNSSVLMQQIQLAEDHHTQTSTKKIEITETEEESFTNSQVETFESKDSNPQVSKLLGLLWDSKDDYFKYDFTKLLQIAKDMPPTKRSLLQITAKIFDPLGFLSPFVIKLKVMFQKLCSGGKDWDTEIKDTLLEQWKVMLSDMKLLDRIEVPRYYHNRNSRPVSVELHGFSDASVSAYAAVLYIRTCYESGQVDVKVMTSKTKVAPKKGQTIPRLELMAALLLARLVHITTRALHSNTEIHCWTDSTCVLYWIQNKKPWKQFITHRVQEIHKLTDKYSWRHCPGIMNPADLPSRGMSATELVTSSLWWQGPTFLQLPKEKWPMHEAVELSEVIDSEMIKTPQLISHVLVTNLVTKTTLHLEKIMELKRFSTLNKLLRVTAFVIRFVNKILRRCEIPCSTLTASELKEARLQWIKSIQSIQFEQEIKCLNHNNQHNHLPRIRQFGLYIGDDKLLRCQGRLGNSNLELCSKEPIILSSNHRFVDLLILEVHLQTKHSSIRETITALREDYWILRVRAAVKKVIHRCVTCRHFEGLPYSTGNPPDLPNIRVSEDPPFSHTGIDFAGPLYIQSNSDKQEKSYICLFTCALTRAIHLELTRGLDAQSFLLAFRRFTSRRGLPNTLISDNAKSFRSSAKEICSICRSNEVLHYFANHQISWKFIIEKAPWWGGFWERMIKSVKLSLKKAIGRSSLTHDELNTVLIEVEAIVNTRPLTYVEDGEEGLNYSLTPSHLINGRRICTTSNSQHHEIVSTHNALTKRYKLQRRLLSQFTMIWRKQYLLELRESHALKGKRQNRHPNIAVGDIVILKDDSTKRAFWKLAKIQELIVGRDQRVRAAVIKAPDSSRCLRRSITQLIPIELKDTNKSDAPGSESN